MRTMIVEDDPVMLRCFMRCSADIPLFEVRGCFQSPKEALEFAQKERVDLAVLDIELPGMSGLTLAGRLREIRSDMLIVFLTAYENHVREANLLKADGYIVKPYTAEILEDLAQRMQLLSARFPKRIRMRMFGSFQLYKNERPVLLTGKAKEILALAASRNGEEILNEEIYSILWEKRICDNRHMSVYYNALGRLRKTLDREKMTGLLISTNRGQILNTEMVECDYYIWLRKNGKCRDAYAGEFLTGFEWARQLL